MATEQDQRPRYYEDQYLGADDLNDAVNFGRIHDARHALGAHTWGIASGLHLIEKERSGGGVDIYLTPGYAWDGFGRPIVVLAPYKIPGDLFRGIAYESTKDEPQGRLIKIWLRYDEVAIRSLASGFGTCNGESFSRVQETFRVEIGERLINERQSFVTVDAVSAPASEIPEKIGASPPMPARLYDESIPFQQFPEDGSSARWLVPVGYVRWKPNVDSNVPGSFVKLKPADKSASRQLRRSIGVVAETLYPVEDVLRIRGRGQSPASKRWSDDLAWVEGPLRIDGKLNLCHEDTGNLKWQLDGTAANLTIGEANATGPADSRVTIKAGGDVGIGTTTPVARLDVANLVRIGESNKKVIAFARDADDDSNEGKIAYKPEWDPTALAIVGAGAEPNRKIHMWDDLIVQGKVGIGADPADLTAGKLTIEAPDHINVILARTDSARHMTLTVGGVGTGIHFSDRNRFFISADPYAERNTTEFGTELFTILPDGKVGVGTSSPENKLEISGAGATAVDLKVNGRIQTGDGNNNGGVWLNLARTMFMGHHRTNIGFWTRGAEWNTLQITQEGHVEIGTRLRVGRGTGFARMQGGTVTLGSRTSRVSLNRIVNFDIPFSSIPKVIVTARGQLDDRGEPWPDTFAVTTTDIDINSFKVNVQRVDPTKTWDQHLQLDWFAWE